MCVLDAPVRNDDIAAYPYSLAVKPDDLLPPSKLIEEHLFALDNNVFKKLLGLVWIYIQYEVAIVFQGKPEDIHYIILV